MAEQDFAQIEAAAPPRRRWRGLLVALGGVAVVAASFVGGFHLGERHGKALAESEEKKRLMEKLEQQRKENERLRKELAKARAQRGIQNASPFGEDRLLFFEDLPKESIEPLPLPEPEQPNEEDRKALGRLIASARDANASAAAKVQAEKPRAGPMRGHWVVQLAAFRARPDAARLVARLNEAGIKSWVEEALVGGARWYRVDVGPYATRDEAEQARHALHERFALRGLVRRLEALP